MCCWPGGLRQDEMEAEREEAAGGLPGADAGACLLTPSSVIYRVQSLALSSPTLRLVTLNEYDVHFW